MIEPSSGFVRATTNGSDQLKVRPGSRLSFFVHKKISENTWIISLQGQKVRINSDIPLELGKIFRAVVLRQEGRVVLKVQEQTAVIDSVMDRFSLPHNDQVKLILQAFIQQGLPLREEILQRAILFFTSLKETNKTSARFLALLYDKGIFPDRALFERLQYMLREPAAFHQGEERQRGNHPGHQEKNGKKEKENKEKKLEKIKKQIAVQMKNEGPGENLLQLFNHMKAGGDNWLVFPISFSGENVLREGVVRIHTDPAGRTDNFSVSFYGKGEFHFRGSLSSGKRRIAFFMDHPSKSANPSTLISELKKKLHNLSFEIDDTIKGAEIFSPFEGENLTTLKKIDTIV